MSVSQNFPDESPTLDLNFAGSKQLDPRVTFSRSSSATYMDDNGLIITAQSNVPRFDHQYANGEVQSLGLLIEEQRVNLLLRSEELDNNAVWATDLSSVTITSNSVMSPAGVVTADTITEAATNTQHNRYQSVGLVSAVPYTFSVFFKPNTVTRVSLGFGYAGIGGGGQAFFNLSSGTVISTVASGTDPGTNLSASITPYPNGWYRCTFTVTPSRTDLTYYASLNLRDINLNYVYQGNTSNNLYVWGAQLEQGSFPTSYIPTTTATVTRSRDDATLVGSNFTSWYKQSEGTILCIAKYTEGNTTAQTAWSMYNGSVGAIRQMMSPPTGTNKAYMQVEYPTGTYPVSIENGTSINRTNLVKTACAFKTDDYAISMNGAIVSTDTSGTMSNHVNLYLGSVYTGTWILNGSIAQLTYYPKRLSNAEIQTLSR